MKRIALLGQARIDWCRLREKAGAAVYRAVRLGNLQNLKTSVVPCVDCGKKASVYHHENYKKPLEVEPLCISCNILRGTNAPTIKENKSKKRPQCPQCQGYQVLYRARDHTYSCRRCGCRWP